MEPSTDLRDGPPPASPLRARWIAAAIASLALLAGVLCTVPLARSYVGAGGPPLWDMAGHGWQGVELLDDLSRGRVDRFLAHLNAQDKWPFGHSLLLLPFLALGGRSLAAATLHATAAFALLPALLVWAGWEVGRRSDDGAPGGWPAGGAAAGAVAGALVLASPLHRVLAVVLLREAAGAAVAVVALALYLRAVRVGTLAAWRVTAAAALLLLLVKYNYGLLWLLAAVVHVLTEPAIRRSFGRSFRPATRPPADAPAVGARQAAPASADAPVATAAGAVPAPANGSPTWRALAWPWTRAGWRDAGADLEPLLPPPFALRALWVLALASLVLIALGENPGVTVYAGVLLLAGVAVRALTPSRRASTLARWRALAPPLRGTLEALVLPMLVWWLSPSPLHPRTVFDFLRNRPGEPLPLVESLRFYPGSLLHDYAATPALGVATWIGAGLALLAWRRGGAGLRAVALASGVGLALTTLHGYKEPRFVATVVPFLFLLAGLGLIVALRALARHRAAAVALATLAAGAVASCALTSPRLDAAVAALHPLYTGPAALVPALTALPELVADLGIAGGRDDRGPRRLALVGVANELSPDLVRWQLHLDRRRPRVEVLEAPRELAGRARRGQRRGIAGWLVEERADGVLAVEIAATSPLAATGDFQRHNAWQQELVATLPRVATWRESARHEVPALGVTLRFYEPRAAGERSAPARRRSPARRRRPAR